jgi:four helix bundle protein
MGFKFEKLEVWQLALEHIDLAYDIAEQLPSEERYNLKSQLTRAATSVALNIAEGSTGQTDDEHARFLGLAIRSVHETVACLHIIKRRNFPVNGDMLRQAYQHAEKLAAKLQAMRRTVAPHQGWVREDSGPYQSNGEEERYRRDD